MEIIAHLDDSTIEALKLHCQSLTPLLKPSTSTYTVGGRRESWFDKGWTLSQEPLVFDAPHHPLFTQLGRQYFPDNDACLFLYYPEGSYIRAHRDHTVSQNKVVQINLGCDVILTINKEPHRIKDGDVVCFDSKLLHSVSSAVAQRYVISWRKIKPQYLQQQLSLF